MRSGRAAGGIRTYPHWWWLPIAGLLACLAAANPAGAALPQASLATDLDASQSPKTEASGVRVAQSGPLDGLFSIFKPKPKPQAQRLPDQTVAPRKARAGVSGLPRTEERATLGSDPAPIYVRPIARPRSAISGGSRTMCVRLCDGYYWPATSGTRSSSIARDQDICEQSCQSETKLFIRPSLGADAGDMRDLSGKSYKKLRRAFLYRKTYVPECKCRPDPWSTSEQLRHEEYRAAAAGALIGASGEEASETDGLATAAEDPLTPSEGDSSDVDLATGNGEDDSVRVASVEPEPKARPTPQVVSLPSTGAPLPKVKRPKPKSTAKLEAASVKPAPTPRRSAASLSAG